MSVNKINASQREFKNTKFETMRNTKESETTSEIFKSIPLKLKVEGSSAEDTHAKQQIPALEGCNSAAEGCHSKAEGCNGAAG